ncbi:isovaleryl-CoA dehydrogenase, mitochondrial [Eurytemora carolleeae]|uniref:isovaleryl-CoA dehydrogenase, mitochondrial n=1 Tax=Eurytemora carolleeae TaxID=1294199 RepID=UPI000C78EA2D|nr:isovaleryl-CoA dehydrogenase, mitochondrial [Eurytemora carolleeae]|eukprot:XP_023334112.1 isovaleryl-CoA dehydrogenase, mitochondrial-like [Eurytemora affinis]
MSSRSGKILQMGYHQIRDSLQRRKLSFYPINEALYGLTPDQIQLRETVFNFSQKELAPLADRLDKDNGLDTSERKILWRKIGEMGFFGITTKSKYGGSDLSLLDQIIIGEEFSRISPAMGMSIGAQSNLCINQLDRNGTEEQKMKYIPKLCSGEWCGALAMSEAGSGSDVVSMRLQADREGDDFVLNGTKFWITNGPDADVFIVYAKTDLSSQPHHGITAFIVERNFLGFSSGPKLDKLGMRGSNTSELIFDNCRVPKENILGGLNKGVYVLMSGLDIERLVLSAGPVGVMQACCDTAFKYANERKQFGHNISEFQLIQAKMADMHTRLSASRSFLYNVARACDNGFICNKDCATVALFCGENSTKSALDAVQILGGNGYINDYPTGRYLRDSKLFEIGGGTSEVRRLVIGREINKEYK